MGHELVMPMGPECHQPSRELADEGHHGDAEQDRKDSVLLPALHGAERQQQDHPDPVVVPGKR